MQTLQPVIGFLLLLGLGFFFGLAFEEFHMQGGQARPGGVRTFPLLALTGALLYRLDTERVVPLTAGLLVLGVWLTAYYRRHVEEIDPDGRPNVGLMVPICNVLAYLLGPVALVEPPWMAIGVTVTAVMLMTGREQLHRFARGLEVREIVTAGKFLILAGLVLPFLPSEPVTKLTDITPHQVWLAVLAVCAVSYASYLLQRYVAPPGGVLWVAVLGGLYSSTVTTFVLARRARSEPASLLQAQTGIVLATSVMFVRLLIVIAVFNLPLGLAMAPSLLGLAALGAAIAALWYWLRRGPPGPESQFQPPGNPLELNTAFVFAALFVAISLASAWVRGAFGQRGLYVLAAIVGASDIDPFVLSIAGGGAAPLAASAATAAILIAAASNNLVKAAYTIALAGTRAALPPAAALAGLTIAGLGAAWWAANATLN